MLTVEPLGETDVGLGQNLAGVVTPLATFVDLQLDSEVPWTGAIEDGFWLVVVALDHVPVCFLQTGQAERLIAVVQKVTVLTVDEAAALGAGHVALICNEEGKLNGLPLNRALWDEDGNLYDIISGTFFLCAAPPDAENFQSLSEEQLLYYEERFRCPEMFLKVNGKLVCLPISPI